MSLVMRRICTYEQLHWQWSYVPIFNIAIDRCVISDAEKQIHEQLQWQLSYASIFHIATDRRVIRDVENAHL